MRFRLLLLLSLLLTAPAIATAAEPGRLVLPDFTGLAKKATQSVNITLDPSMLAGAAGFLGVHGKDDAALENVVKGLRGIYVRSYHFAHAGAYSKADVKMIVDQLVGPHWKPLVSVHDHKEGSDVEIYVCGKRGVTEGMAILAAKPRELTIVNIVGEIDLSKLAQLQGQFGVPKVGAVGAAK